MTPHNSFIGNTCPENSHLLEKITKLAYSMTKAAPRPLDHLTATCQYHYYHNSIENVENGVIASYKTKANSPALLDQIQCFHMTTDFNSLQQATHWFITVHEYILMHVALLQSACGTRNFDCWSTVQLRGY